jgi:hypothetical protein
MGEVTVDPDTIKRYFAHARRPLRPVGACPRHPDAERAVRCLTEHQVLYLRHYRHDRQEDLHLR